MFQLLRTLSQTRQSRKYRADKDRTAETKRIRHRYLPAIEAWVKLIVKDI